MNSRISFCFFVIGFVSMLISCSQKEPGFSGNIDFQQGDLVFRKGIGAKSQAVLYADSQGIYTHVGIVVLQDSVFKVVHVTPGESEAGETVEKVKMEPVGDFWRTDRAQNGAVYRLKDNTSGTEAAQEALLLLQQELTFDHDYKLSDTTKMYCTELVWTAYKKAGKDISNGKRSELNTPMYTGTYIFPSDIMANNELILIYNF